MNPVITILFLITFISCSSSRINRKISESYLDAMAEESLLRWNEQRLNSIPTSLANLCYKDENGRVKFKEQFQQHSTKEFYWIQLGNCYFLTEKWPKAEFYYRLALESSTNKSIRTLASNNLALLSFKYQQWKIGHAYLKEAISLNPAARVPKFNLSQLYIQFGQFDLALSLLTSSVFIGVQDVDLNLSLGTIWLFKGDLKKADIYLGLIPGTYTQREDVAAVLALLELKKGNLIRAKDVLESRDRSHVPELTTISQNLNKIINNRLQQE